jgi:YkoP-like protein
MYRISGGNRARSTIILRRINLPGCFSRLRLILGRPGHFVATAMSSVVGAAPAITRPLWTKLIFAFDGCLRRRAGVFEYSDAPDCIFRAQLSRIAENVALADGSLGRAGDRVIDLHFWNEQIPVQAPGGNSLAWGCRFNRCFTKSLLALAQFLKSNAELADVKIIRANINLEMLDRIAERHGFEPICNFAAPPTWKHLHEFGENILFWLLTLACNPNGARCRQFWRRRRLLYLSRRALDRAFGNNAAGSSHCFVIVSRASR